MFEFLVEDRTNANPAEGEEPRRFVVALKGLLDEIEKAIEDDNYCIVVYEIHRRVLDWSLPREEGKDYDA